MIPGPVANKAAALLIAVCLAAGAVGVSACGGESKPERQRTHVVPADVTGGRVGDVEQARRIMARDPGARELFAGQRPVIETTGIWEGVDGILLKVAVQRPIRGIHRIPDFSRSGKPGSTRIFRVDIAGATKFHVLVDFTRKRVAAIEPLAEGRAAP